MNNGAILNPNESILMISARVSDITVVPEDDFVGDSWVTIIVENFKDGIEIVCDRDALWWPV